MAWFRRLWNTFRSERIHGDISREISFHIAERTDQLRAEGLSEQEARRRARLQFGSVAAQAERTRDMDIALWAEALLRSVRYAVRTLGRAPGFTATAVLTLALGIGANSAVFSALDAVVLRPLPFPESDRLMRLREIRGRTTETGIAPVRLEDWKRLNATFQHISGYYTEDISETSGDLPEKVTQATVARDFVEVWRVAPALGRGFTGAEHRFGGPPAVLISDRYWRRRLGADPNVLARTVRIEALSIPIVGVMPASFLFPDRNVDLWRPILVDADYAQSRRGTLFQGIGRLKPGVTLEQARGNLAAVQAQLGEQFPETDANIGVEIVPLKDATLGDIGSSLWLLFGAVSVLLLITCTNIAALLLSRATQRQQEVSIRLSLGATRATVAGQALTEAMILALAGASLGLLIATGATAVLRSFGADLPRLDEIVLDRRILLYTLASSVTVALLCGVVPATRAARYGLSGALGDVGRAQVSTRNSLQWLLVGTQVALSVTLLAGAGLLVRSFHELSCVNPGFEPSRVLTFRMTGSWAEMANMDRLVQRFDRSMEELQALPGVDAVATSFILPGVRIENESTFELVEARSERERGMVAQTRSVSPTYFETMQIPLLDGEYCRRQVPGTARDIVVNETFASRYLSERSSLAGLHLRRDAGAPLVHRIVGVVGNARERGLHHLPGPVVYWCATWSPMPHFLVRTSGEPLAVAQAVRLKMKELDPLRSVYNISPLEEKIDDAFQEDRLRAALLVLFAVTALLLASVGLYGTLSYVVSLRRREIGLRLALGAQRPDIIRQFLIQGLRVAGLACVCGLVFSIAFSRVLSSMLYGVSASDPITLSGVTAIVLIVAAIASLVPAIRGARLDPMRVLRDE